MSRRHQQRPHKRALIRQKERLAQLDGFSLFVVLLPFLAVVLLSLYTSLETNTRLMARGKPMEHQTIEMADHRLWLSVSSINGKTRVASSDSAEFSWDEDEPSSRELENFRVYLKAKVDRLVIDAVRTGQVDRETLTAALAVDQSLTFKHIRPIIYALADAGVSRYGFETRIIH